MASEDGKHVFTVRSESNPNKTYEVTLFPDNTFWCSCPSFKFVKDRVANRYCKHLLEVRSLDASKPAASTDAPKGRTRLLRLEPDKE